MRISDWSSDVCSSDLPDGCNEANAPWRDQGITPVGKAHPTRYPDPVFEPPPAPMIAAVRPMIALLAGVALLLMGRGLLGSLLVVRGAAEGFGAPPLGLVMAAYFVWFLVGTWIGPRPARMRAA